MRPRQKKRVARCRIKYRSEYALWLVLVIIAVLLVTVNFVLLEQPQEGWENNKNNIITNERPASNGGDIGRSLPPDVDDPLTSVLRAAGVDDTPELRRKLPSWREFVDRFGDRPRIVGMDTCDAYRESVPASERMIAPAGTFNSGTNLLHRAMLENCEIPRISPGGRRLKNKRRDDVQWEVNWGKHQPPRYRSVNRKDERFENAFYLPVVTVRDPYTWMQSMCKVRYSAHWFHVVPDHCPNFIPNHVEREWFDKSHLSIRLHYDYDPWRVDNIWDKANYTLDSEIVPLRVRYKNGHVFHDSLVHMWNDWYQDYHDSDFPRLMIRLEDLVFRPAEVLEQICSCAGGKFAGAEGLKMNGDPAKAEGVVHCKNQTNLVGAMASHVYTNRTEGMTREDIEFVESYLKSSKMMEVFGYATSPT